MYLLSPVFCMLLISTLPVLAFAFAKSESDMGDKGLPILFKLPLLEARAANMLDDLLCLGISLKDVEDCGEDGKEYCSLNMCCVVGVAGTDELPVVAISISKLGVVNLDSSNGSVVSRTISSKTLTSLTNK